MKKKQKKLRKLPVFKNEDEERDFWSTHSLVDYFDMGHAVKMSFPNLKLSTKTISIRLPEWMIDNIKMEANKNDMPYQSLIKILLSEKLEESKKKAA